MRSSREESREVEEGGFETWFRRIRVVDVKRSARRENKGGGRRGERELRRFRLILHCSTARTRTEPNPLVNLLVQDQHLDRPVPLSNSNISKQERQRNLSERLRTQAERKKSSRESCSSLCRSLS